MSTPFAQPSKSFSLLPSSPSSSASTSRKYQSTRPIRSKSLPIIIPSSPPTPKNDPTVYPELPSDPKTWTSDHVALYLTYCLRLYPPAIIRDLTRYVSEEHTLTGKRFMRLKEENLRHMGFNERWIKLIMMGVKALRRQSLKDKILGNNGDYKDIVEEDEIEELEDEDMKSGDESVSLLSTEDKTFIQPTFTKLKDEVMIDLRDQQNTVDAPSDPQSHNRGSCLPPPNTGASVQRFSWSYIFSWPLSLSRILTGLWLLKREVLENIPQHRFSQGFAVGGFVVWAWTRVSRTARQW
ncbi:6868_t:CDS:2 [Paraglomus brasilianum]|uniref:6868_t:CDS:1 n=1 Tax=Paraglomus brasilianum TaxID=144538 RepID=A0A9N8W0Y4_9GLOM|nr:6868_t:CDS:2 [Paraglomus brasilianum]